MKNQNRIATLDIQSQARASRLIKNKKQADHLLITNQNLARRLIQNIELHPSQTMKGLNQKHLLTTASQGAIHRQDQVQDLHDR